MSVICFITIILYTVSMCFAAHIQLLMAKLSNDTELLHDLFSTTHVPATELSVAVIQTLKFIAQNEVHVVFIT
jgi:hypothetical protein